MFLTTRRKVIARRKSLIFKQQIKVTLKLKLKILGRYVVKISAKVEHFIT